MTTQPHHCKCYLADKCFIHTHPSIKVQEALNNLMDIMAKYDEETGASSAMSFTSRYEAGVFTSVTANASGDR